MKVTLLDYTGAGRPDRWWAARLLVFIKNTRLEQTPEGFERWLSVSQEEIEKELLKVANTIRSSWEFVEYTFQINEVTRGFTHQLVRTRAAAYAQQSQRTVSMDGFTYMTPASVEENLEQRLLYQDCMGRIDGAYRALVALGAAKEDARGLLPTNIHTNIIAKFNLRTFASLVSKRLNLRAQGEYREVVQGMINAVSEVHPWVGPFLFPERTDTPHLDALIKTYLGDRAPTEVPGMLDILKDIDKLKATWE